MSETNKRLVCRCIRNLFIITGTIRAPLKNSQRRIKKVTYQRLPKAITYEKMLQLICHQRKSVKTRAHPAYLIVCKMRKFVKATFVERYRDALLSAGGDVNGGSWSGAVSGTQGASINPHTGP